MAALNDHWRPFLLTAVFTGKADDGTELAQAANILLG
ncbi:hypothetical protein FHW37_10268 [Neorhizobium alkalisoli]|uniref:Uncharacterized protein n=1 Tax=Neorhizobium alkalisoli TaxID=528178 RepID=A0A561R1F1_9HYPH|nr:hypothetical protein FHW37_10268 [Neorhizobium alkalisoli]